MATTGAGSAHTHDLDLGNYATKGEIADLNTRLLVVEAWIAAHPNPTPIPTPTPTPIPTPAAGVYGSGLSGDSRANLQIGWSNRARISYRFRSRGGTAVSFRVQERGGPIYSGGDGGQIRATIQKDNGTGQPDGAPLASLTWAPGNPKNADGSIQAWEVWTLHTFQTPATLQAGGLYHLVFDNMAADPVGNYISLNGLFHFGSTPIPRQAAFSDDFAFMYAKPTTWAVQVQYVPIFDLAYSDGGHDGSAYIGTLWDKYGDISGAAQMVREKFNFTGTRTFQAAHVRLKRITGTAPLVVTLERTDGTQIEKVSIPASAVATGAVPDGSAASLGGDTWVHAPFTSARTLAPGQYALRLSTDASTRYVAVPLQQGTSKGLASRVFGDGDGQRTTDGGTNWANLYLYDSVDLQFWLD